MRNNFLSEAAIKARRLRMLTRNRGECGGFFMGEFRLAAECVVHE
jgi:hypothetical protein